MAERIETPCKACHGCWKNYTLTEWRNLPLVETEGTVESRKCSCGELLTLDMDGIDKLDLTDDPADYREAHPDTGRITVADISKPTPKPAARPTTQRTDPTVKAIVKASLRNLPEHVNQGLWLWMRRLPHEADSFTLGELRVLRGQR